MHKIVIVDDEPSIREGLAQLLDWTSLGYKIAGLAASGKEALRQYEDIRPDLMIVDIRMPGMDGLELIRELKRRADDLQVLVLSGYADFDYARRAISLGVTNYLLKPVDEDELSDNLKTVAQLLDDKAKKRGKAGRAALADRGAWLGELLTGQASAAQWQAELSGRGMEEESYQIMLVDVSCETGEATCVQQKILERLAVFYEQPGAGVVFKAGAHIGLLLGASRLRDSNRRRLLTALRDWTESSSCSTAVAAGERIRRAADIPHSYATARCRLQQRFFYDGAEYIDEETAGRLPAPVPGPVEPQLLQAVTERLYLAVSTGNISRVAPLVEALGSLMLDAGAGEIELKARFVQLLAGLLEKLSARHPAARLASEMHAARLPAIHGAAGYASMLSQIAQLLTEAARQADDGTGERQIRKITQLIDSHYRDNLKLEKLAEAFNYNPAYLGKLFKTVTGESFNTYLDKVRIDQAKRLLRAGLKVYEVAEQVGYANPDYFHGKFRKYVGQSPTSYRSQLEPAWAGKRDDG
ncbi:response regulator transcription factor [Cohnella sp. 56]|uniref:response regulator transcription factor n=1 Tax=Cohnella sp. 56 TaxID=3113722 RepID=UPI0030EAA659